MTIPEKARQLLTEWKKEQYVFGLGVLDQLGENTKRYGTKAAVIANETYLLPVTQKALGSLQAAGVTLAGGRVIRDARPNAPREDVYRIAATLLQHQPDVLVAIGGGSTLDAAKAANVLYTLGGICDPEIDPYFGTGCVTERLKASGRKLLPMIAVETSASSGAHLTKYANITDPAVGQKKLIVDLSIVPDFSLFDYSVTTSMPVSVTIDGALDAIAHTFEVFCGASPEAYSMAEELATSAIALVLENAKTLIQNPNDLSARECIGLATDLGGMAIMIGGTSGAHLTSFSLVDIVPHGTACGLMNPYYAVFFGPAIQPQLRSVGALFHQFGLMEADPSALSGRELALAVAKAMIAFNRSIGAPATLKDLPGFTSEHIVRALAAAKDPQLEMKLRNMPVPMEARDVDPYMAPILNAAATGDLHLIQEKE